MVGTNAWIRYTTPEEQIKYFHLVNLYNEFDRINNSIGEVKIYFGDMRMEVQGGINERNYEKVEIL